MSSLCRYLCRAPSIFSILPVSESESLLWGGASFRHRPCVHAILPSSSSSSPLLSALCHSWQRVCDS